MAKRKRTNWSNSRKKSTQLKTTGQYFVEQIRDWALDRSGKLMFLLKWESYPEEDNSWEFDEQLFDCQELRQQFETECVNGRHPPKYSWEEFYKFVDYMKLIISNEYKDWAVLNRLSSKTRTFAELKSNKVIEDIKLHIECHFSKLLINKFEKKTNIERIEAKELLERVSKSLRIGENFGTITHFFEFVDKRESVVHKLEDWQIQQNKIIAKEGEGLPISIVNDVDLELPTLEKYITKYIIDVNIGSHFNQLLEEYKPVHSCECKNCYQDRNECCTAVIGFPMAYNSKGFLSHTRFSTTIFECNSLCKCGTDCPNRAIQRGRQSRLQVFRTECGARGWGVRTLDPIARGAFVTLYTGEIISLTEADKRPTTYLYDLTPDLDTTDAEYTYVVDAHKNGNVARFINHSCDPNCRAIFAWTNNYHKSLPLVALFAEKPIHANEELTYDYGMELIDLYLQRSINKSNEDGLSTDSGNASSNHENNSHKSDDNDGDSSDDEEKTRNNQIFIHNRNTRKVSFKKIDCLCGSNNCRKFLYS